MELDGSEGIGGLEMQDGKMEKKAIFATAEGLIVFCLAV